MDDLLRNSFEENGLSLSKRVGISIRCVTVRSVPEILGSLCVALWIVEVCV